MGDSHSSVHATDSSRRRRGPNELVWTQPRTVAPSLHKNARNLSKLPADPANKDGRLRKRLGGQNSKPWQQGNISGVMVSLNTASESQTKDLHMFDWSDMDLLDLAGASDTTDDAAVIQPPISQTSTNLRASCTPTSPPTDHGSYQMLTEADYMGNIIPTLADDVMDDIDSNLPAVGESSLRQNWYNGFSAIHLAAHAGNHSAVRLLFLSCPEALDLGNKNAQTPLHIAVSEGHRRVVSELIRAGANISLQDAERRTPLHLAVIKERPEILEILLDEKYGESVIHQADGTGKTPLHYAVLQDCDQIIQLLLDKGADPKMPIGEGIRGRS